MFNVIIVGGGVEDFSAGLFTSRRGLKTLVIGKDVAGQANFSDTIENFPGLEEIGGYDLVSTIRRQAEKYGAEYLQAEVSKLKFASDAFVVTAYDKQYKTQNIIFAFCQTTTDFNVTGGKELKS